MPTRIITGLIRGAGGEPLPRIPVTFRMVRATHTADAIHPRDGVSVTTANDGTFSASLQAGLSTAWECSLPGFSSFRFTLPEGPPISLSDLQLEQVVPPLPTITDRLLPTGGTTGQALVKVSDDDYDAEWGDVAATWGGIGGTLSDQTDLANALGSKADSSALTTHTSNTANPHNVTKAQVGLGSVDNTSDAAKPISTATQTALDAKLATADAPELIRDTMGTALVAGSNVTITPNDGTDTITIAASGGGDGLLRPLLLGHYAMTDTHGLGRDGGHTTLTMAANELVLVPVILPIATTYTHNQIHVSTASTAGVVRLGLFAFDVALNTATLLADAAEISTATTGLKITSGLSVAAPTPGWYWIGLLPSESFSMRAFVPALGVGGNVANLTRQSWIRRAVAYGSFAATYSGSWLGQTGPETPLTGFYRG